MDFSTMGASSVVTVVVAVDGAGPSVGDSDKALSCTASVNAAVDASSKMDLLSII